LNSYACYIPEQKLNEENMRSKWKYKYYVGKGNNKNLIISILKKRWWWAETDDIAAANFVWTQLKVANVI
jgi:hypothetical protein